MPSRINIGPENGPYVELDEENGEFVIRVPEDEVNFDQSDLRNVKDFTAESVSTKALNTDTIYAGAYSGADADARLDAALSDFSGQQEIILEQDSYSVDRTFSGQMKIGSSGPLPAGCTVSGDWTFNDIVHINNVRIGSPGTITLESRFSRASNISRFDGDVVVDADICVLYAITEVDVTFNSGTSGGVIDASGDVSVTDNGTNTVGDIA